MEQAGRSKIHEAKRWLNLLRCRIMISEVIHELFMHQASWCPQIPLKKFMKTFSWCLNTGKLKTEQKFIFLPCLDSLPLFNCFVGTLVLSLARPNFLTGAIMWTWFQSLLPAPPPPLGVSGYSLFNTGAYLHESQGPRFGENYIIICQNVFNLHVSFQSSSTINCMLITRLICIQ